MKTTFLSAILGSVVLLSSSCCKSADDCETDKTMPDATAAVMENIMTRTSIRQFTDQPISEDTLNMIVKAGMAAPSAMNKQPWAFIVITDREMLDSLKEVHPYSNLKTATAAIVVCGDLSKTDDGNEGGYWVQDCSAASENILLAAHAYGLGAVWCGVYPNPNVRPEVSRILGVPENVIPLNIITMGFPAENPEPKDKFKNENIHYQKW